MLDATGLQAEAQPRFYTPCNPAPRPGEPKGQTYGGVYQPGPEERGTAEAATYSAPTRE